MERIPYQNRLVQGDCGVSADVGLPVLELAVIFQLCAAVIWIARRLAKEEPEPSTSAQADPAKTLRDLCGTCVANNKGSSCRFAMLDVTSQARSTMSTLRPLMSLKQSAHLANLYGIRGARWGSCVLPTAEVKVLMGKSNSGCSVMCALGGVHYIPAVLA